MMSARLTRAMGSISLSHGRGSDHVMGCRYPEIEQRLDAARGQGRGE